MLKKDAEIIILADHLWNPNPFCSAFAHEGDRGYIKSIEEEYYVLMLNSKYSPDEFDSEHKVEIERASKYIKEIN